MEAALFSALTAVAGGLYAHVAARVYPEAMPQGAAQPCIVYRRVSTARQQALGSAQTVLSSRPRFQFTVWALTAASAWTIADALLTQLRATSYAVTVENEWTMRDPETNLHRRDVDCFILHGGQ